MNDNNKREKIFNAIKELLAQGRRINNMKVSENSRQGRHW